MDTETRNRLDEMSREAMREINKAYGQMFAQPRYRYYARSNSKDRYFYTTEKINHKGKARYVAGIYRHLKTKNQWKLVKRVGFAKKYKAKDWAREMSEREEKRKATPPEVAINI